MSRIPRIRSRIIFASAVGILATVVNATNANADTYANANASSKGNNGSNGGGMGNTAMNTAMEWYKDSGIRIGGWINGGATFNPTQLTGFNGPVTFDDRSNRAQLNQFYLYLQRPVVAEGSSWDFGFRADFMFGSDAIFTQAYGVPAFDVTTGQPLSRSNLDSTYVAPPPSITGSRFPRPLQRRTCRSVTDSMSRSAIFIHPLGMNPYPRRTISFILTLIRCNMGSRSLIPVVWEITT